ncbi:hypothetical protein [Curtobacterium sp. MCBD17_040]|uniref:hypothetical protein n=1 Tax=Curtobacterium sp. MCBD17_040 TaxID=2175674 RepID=UPI000DA84B92|nr:hypothetical protein [Curtobacterium sp. MCBD17_040]WIB65089.1 hypothetical protein DEI94_07865 [Curtobacterium sp. MCBD17_040]
MTVAPTSRSRTTALAVGAGSAAVGLLPWIITGMRLPLQNLWASDVTSPHQMPIALLPFSQYDVALMASMLVGGGALAGVLFRAVRVPRTIGTVLAALIGVFALDLVAVVESAVVTGVGLRRPTGYVATFVTPEQVYLFGLVVIALSATVVALVACSLVVAVPAPGPVIGIALAAATLTDWADALVVRPTTAPPTWSADLLSVSHLLPGLAVGVAVGSFWQRPFGRQIVGAVVAFGLAWIGPTSIAALTGALGSRALLTVPSEFADFAVLLFTTEARSWQVWGGVLIGVVVAVALIVVRSVRARATATTRPPGAASGDGRHGAAASRAQRRRRSL